MDSVGRWIRWGLSGWAAEAEMLLTVVGVVEVAERRVVTPAVRRVVPRGHALPAQPDSELLKALAVLSGRLFSQRPTCPADSSALSDRRRRKGEGRRCAHHLVRRVADRLQLGGHAGHCSAAGSSGGVQRQGERPREGGSLFRGMAAKPLTGSAGL